MVASKLYDLSDNNSNFSLHYDSDRKKNVDFIIDDEFNANVAIGVGRGKKDKKQVIHAMNHYNSKTGIIISDKISKKKRKMTSYAFHRKPFHCFNFINV